MLTPPDKTSWCLTHLRVDGVSPEQAWPLVQHILGNCPKLQLSGLMSIGKIGEPADVYFERLVQCRAALVTVMPHDDEMTTHALGLSMGMSADFESAVRYLNILKR